jgi:hypothetical protein
MMGQVADPRLAGWANFYVIVGSAAAALISVQFVVIALIANLRKPATLESISAFGTPTVVHLGGALLVSAVMSAPWPSLLATSVAFGLCGLGGVVYVADVIRRARRQTTYAPVAEDWVWHAIIPGIMYVSLGVAAVLLRRTPPVALFVVGGALLGLLVVGIHNAWDTVTFMVVGSLGDVGNANGSAGVKARTDPRTSDPSPSPRP